MPPCGAFSSPFTHGQRKAGESGCTPTACVRFLRRRSPAGLRNTLFDLSMLHFSRSAHRDFCVCEVEAVLLPSAYSAGCRNARCPLVKMTIHTFSASLWILVSGIPFDLINASELTKSAFYAWSEEARKEKENCDNGAITTEEFSRWRFAIILVLPRHGRQFRPACPDRSRCGERFHR